MALLSPSIGEATTGMAASSSISGSSAISACAAMAFFYVAILYSPTLIFRLPPPTSLESFLIRRFVCAIVSSIVSVIATSILLGLGRLEEVSQILGVFGVRGDHLLKAVVIPLLLTSLLYAGSLVFKLWLLIDSWRGDCRVSSCRRVGSYERVGIYAQKCIAWISSRACDVMAWRNYVVAPFTEELVFRACMIPLLLCGGFKTYNIIFFSPVFFSLAHLNHFLELRYWQGYDLWKAFLIVGLQLGYTVAFGWYASFLFTRTGNVMSPIVAHVFCNVMGLPVLSASRTRGLATIAFAAGFVGFFWLLFPATTPDIYNYRKDGCSCWHGYCYWE
ncbi:CAAX prenyl protease 2 isoform X1 [Typha latifolia]|uniref:CAAX prenyl protease 2 isoform X1 n=1 Tax=Typha latifolia TaxID=4733 RepID=UPI003C2F15E5